MFFALGSSWRRSGMGAWDHANRPLNALVTFAEPRLIEDMMREPWKRVMLDSGAFSAWNRGATIDRDELTKATMDPRFTEAVALDVIGDADASMRNALAMKAAGSPAFPVFHYNDPWEHLEIYKREFGRVGLSCRFGEPMNASVAWLEQCFARAWPCRFHSFGLVSPEALARFPFDTADAISWMSPQMFGSWNGYGRANKKHFGFRTATTAIPTTKDSFDMTVEIESYLAVQRFLEYRWAKELQLCRQQTSLASSASPTPPPSPPLT